MRDGGALVEAELSKLWLHLLGPLGAESRPRSVEEATDQFVALLSKAERSVGFEVDGRLRSEVTDRLRKAGVL